MINSRLRKARHQLVDDFLHEHVRHTWTAALRQLERCPQVDHVRGISVPVVVVVVVVILMSIARYLQE